MNVFAKFDEIRSMIFEVIKETNCYGHMVGRSDGRMDSVKTVYPPTNTVCGGYNNRLISKHKKPEKICIYTKAMALLRITKGNYSNSIGP